MIGSTPSMILRLRSSAFAFSFGAFLLAACASPENAIFDEPDPVEDAGADVRSDASTPGTDTDASDDAAPVDAADDVANDTAPPPPVDDTCGLAACPEPYEGYEGFEKCCTSTNQCGFRNGPSGFCYEDEEPDPDPGTGGGFP